jgi:hypothetical protein
MFQLLSPDFRNTHATPVQLQANSVKIPTIRQDFKSLFHFAKARDFPVKMPKNFYLTIDLLCVLWYNYKDNTFF